ncbi:hypothetical protein V8E36_006976 [Tilletia maclaganii]
MLGLWLQAKTGHGDFSGYHTRPHFNHPEAHLFCRCGKPKTRLHPLRCPSYAHHQHLLSLSLSQHSLKSRPSPSYSTPRPVSLASRSTPPSPRRSTATRWPRALLSHRPTRAISSMAETAARCDGLASRGDGIS